VRYRLADDAGPAARRRRLRLELRQGALLVRLHGGQGIDDVFGLDLAIKH
jgi:hypothetical protein